MCEMRSDVAAHLWLDIARVAACLLGEAKFRQWGETRGARRRLVEDLGFFYQMEVVK